MKIPIRKTTLWKGVLVIVLVFAGGVAAGWFMHIPSPIPTYTTVREPSTNYTFIDPILYSTVPESLSFPQYTPLYTALASLASTTVSSGNATNVSIYFRDMNAGLWVGINPGEKFSPASMLKVVTLISTYREAENFPQLLSARITVDPSFTQANDQQDFYPPANPVTPGNTYSVQELLSHLIINSDNNANTLLIKYLGDAPVQKTFTDLNLPYPSTDTSDVDTAQEYSHLFRVLYNATYLSPANSELALGLLTKTTFTQGLVAGVPAGTTVAHKFGERTVTQPGFNTQASHELHDCGIVYYPAHPYFLCIMTKGSDFPTLAAVIQNTSRIVWTNVDSLYAKSSN